MTMNLLRSQILALKSKGKHSQALKANESEVEFPAGDSDEDPAVVENMTMLYNKLQYLARKKKKFLSRNSGYIGSRKEDQKGCFNCKKPGHFIVDCPNLEKEKSKEKSKKPTFKSNKFKR